MASAKKDRREDIRSSDGASNRRIPKDPTYLLENIKGTIQEFKVKLKIISLNPKLRECKLVGLMSTDIGTV